MLTSQLENVQPSSNKNAFSVLIGKRKKVSSSSSVATTTSDADDANPTSISSSSTTIDTTAKISTPIQASKKCWSKEKQCRLPKLVKQGMPVCSEGEVNKYGIGLYVGRKLSDAEIFDVIEHLWSPDENFEFTKPKVGVTPRDKKFVRGWLQT